MTPHLRLAAPYPEPQGYLAEPSFVKSNPLNNDYYVEQMKDDGWYPAIKRLHDTLTELIPGYNIAQIKQKFGELRFYYDPPEEIPVGEFSWNNTPEKIVNRCESAVRYAEGWCAGYDARIKEEN